MAAQGVHTARVLLYIHFLLFHNKKAEKL